MRKSEFLETILPFVSRASRYLGTEINAVHKDLARVDIRFALAFPDVYEVGMSHLGLQILYSVLNLQQHIACERVFTPWPDMEAVLREQHLPLCSLESCLPLNEFNIIGFSLEYELGYSNVLKMLELAGIPLLAEKRDERYPLIIAGGPCTYNPEPVAPFFDAIIIGEGEEVVLEVCDIYRRWKKSKAHKMILLDELSEVPGVYIPAYFTPEYHPDGTIRIIDRLEKGYDTISKRFVSSLDHAPYCTASIVPFMQIIHDRISLEIARGCSRGCRFCMAGMVYRPVREKSMQHITELAEQTLAATGYEELSLCSLSTGDYSGIAHLLQMLMAQHKNNRIAISLPSLRAETLTRSVMEEIKQVRKTGFTIAPEAGTQRLRNVINKGLTEEDILETVRQVFAAGWNLIKLYFMIGLPTETQEDIEGIVALSRKIASIGKSSRAKNQINVSVSTFVPKSHTPFQWVGQIAPEQVYEKQEFLKNTLRDRGIRLKWHSHYMSLLEGVFARGDRRLSAVLIKAHSMGACFDGWTEHLQPGLWEQAFKECGIDKNFYLRQRSLDEILPWEHISCGVNVEFLKDEYRRALLADITPDCRRAGCQGCGLCTGDTIEMAAIPQQQQIEPVQENPASPATADTPSCHYLCTFSKTGPMRFISHLELSRSMARALRRARLPLKYSQGFHPLPRVTFHDALPVGMESQGELFDLELTHFVSAQEIPGRVNPHLPEGLQIYSCHEITLKKTGLADTMQSKNYLVQFPAMKTLNYPDAERISKALKNFHAQTEFPVRVERKGEITSVDIRPVVTQLCTTEDGSLAVTITSTGKRTPKLADIVGEVLGLGDKEKIALKIIKLPAETQSSCY